MKRITSNTSNLLPFLFLLTFGVVTALLYWRLPFFSDDLSYQITFTSARGLGTGGWPLYKYFNAIGFHWLHTNGRFANYLAMTLLAIKPQWILALIIGFVDTLWVYGVLKITGIWDMKRNVTATALVTGLCFFTFQWWDVVIVDCNICYVWSSSFGLLFYILLTKCANTDGINGPKRLLLLAFSLLAGGMHETVGAPLCGALLVTYVLDRHKASPTKLQKQMFLLFGIGTLMVIASPAAWSRAGNPGAPDDPVLTLLLKSEPWLYALLVILFVLVLLPSTRQKTLSYLKSSHGFWILAALLSTVFVCMGGKVGRAGWFAQTASLIAIIQCLMKLNPRISQIKGACISTAIYCLMALQGIMTDIECFKAAGPDLLMREEMAKTGKTLLFHDLSHYYKDVPWWSLGRIRVMKCHDEYSRYLLQMYYHLPSIPKILPEDASGIDFNHFKGVHLADKLGKKYEGVHAVRLKDGSLITDCLPSHAASSTGADWYTHDTWTIQDKGKRIYAVEFNIGEKTFYHLVEWVPEPGDR